MAFQEIVFVSAFFLYFGLGFYLIQPKAFEYNVLKLRLRLFPYFFKWIGLILCIAVIILGRIYWDDYRFTKELAFYGANLGLLFIAFSREKLEDEFANHLRLRSLIVSTISTIIIMGACFPMYMFYVYEARPWLSRVSAPLIVDVLLAGYLFYFYYSRFKLRREKA